MTESYLEKISCNLCGSDDVVVLLAATRQSGHTDMRDEFRSSGDEKLKDRLVRCAHCGLIYVSPRIKSSVALEGYSSAADETFVSQARGRERTFQRCLNLVQEYWKKPPGRILDVGTANGSFLEVAKEAGWETYGCEPNTWMCEWAQKNYGLEIRNGTIFDSKFSSQYFDIITLWDVLEHTPDPVRVLKECFRTLKNEGLLVVNYPDIGSWISRLMGKKWVFLLSVHYFYFTRQTIKNMLKKTGFSVLRIKPHIQNLELNYILKRATPYIGRLASILQKIISLLGLSKAQIPYWIGQTIVIARKSNIEGLST